MGGDGGSKQQRSSTYPRANLNLVDFVVVELFHRTVQHFRIAMVIEGPTVETHSLRAGQPAPSPLGRSGRGRGLPCGPHGRHGPGR